MALIELVERLSNCIENKNYAVGVFIDLKKAFDTVDHKIMLKKLERYGITVGFHTAKHLANFGQRKFASGGVVAKTTRKTATFF